jgi:hypothetical protein
MTPSNHNAAQLPSGTVPPVVGGCGNLLKIGDIVSRTGDGLPGDDLQEVIGRNDSGDLILLRCITPDAGGVFAVGDEEWNLPRRYTLVHSPNPAVEGRTAKGQQA